MFPQPSVRTRQRIHTLLLAFGGGLLACPAASAQTYVNQDGRLFDANPQIGSGGYNAARPVSPLSPGNLTAGGYARGGMSLQSRQTISDPLAFRGALGSDSLASFRRDSVSVADSAAGPLRPGIQPYYDPSRTVGTVGFLQRQGGPPTLQSGIVGMNRPVTEGPGVRLNPRDPLDQRIDLRANVAAAGPASAGQRTDVTSSLFGVRPIVLPAPAALAQQQQREMATVINPRTMPGVTPTHPAAESNSPYSRTTPGSEPLGTPMDMILSGKTTDILAGPRMAPLPGPIDPRAASVTPGVVARPPPPAPTEPPVGTLPAPKVTDVSVLPGHDVFTDMRLAVALARDPNASWFEEMKQAMKDNPRLAQEQLKYASIQGEQFVQMIMKSPVRSFVGYGASEINSELSKAESLLQSGQFYDAASEYDRARVLDPANPLPLIGKANALIAAGEYLSAAVNLLSGLERFPELTQFPVDITSLMGGGEVVDIRRADIANRLRDNDDPRLRFLLGYLDYYTGNHQSGLENFEKAAAASPPRSFIARFPDMLKGNTPLPPPQMSEPPRTRPSTPPPPTAPSSRPLPRIPSGTSGLALPPVSPPAVPAAPNTPASAQPKAPSPANTAPPQPAAPRPATPANPPRPRDPELDIPKPAPAKPAAPAQPEAGNPTPAGGAGTAAPKGGAGTPPPKPSPSPAPLPPDDDLKIPPPRNDPPPRPQPPKDDDLTIPPPKTVAPKEPK